MNKCALYIKNMVCPRCIMAVETELRNLNISYTEVTLGVVKLEKSLGKVEFARLKQALESLGFELLSDKKSKIVEKIKNFIIQVVHHQNEPEKIGHLSVQLPKYVGMDYASVSRLFSEAEGITIEKYLILQKIERAKELIFYGELTMSEIAFQLNYSSSQHFSNQFKSVTGVTPGQFRKNKMINRKPLDEI
ncbi:AraC family transcriptional regulator [Marinilabiliaceae bacterium JC017]|nr:AraC family transcriptional regulator [Marinilabiliaceae bacterium JC017]